MSASNAPNRYQGMSKAELIREISSLKGSQSHTNSPSALEVLQRTVQDLEIHQAELEMQKCELEEAQKLLELSRDSYATLYDYAPTGYVSLDTSGIILNLNFTASDLMGMDRKRAIGFPFGHFVARDHAMEFWDHLRRCRRGDTRVVTEVLLAPRRQSADANPAGVPVQLISVPASGNDEDITVYWTALMDLGDRRKLELEKEERIREQARREEAERANGAKDEFLATLSHELRTPLNVISGWVQLLKMEGLPQGEKSRGYDIIQKSVRQQVQIIDDLLDMSRIIRGMMHIENAAVNLSNLLRETIASARIVAEEKSVSLDLELPETPAITIGDASRLNQVFSNLLQNAVKFTPPGGSAAVRLEVGRARSIQGPHGDVARIAVNDTGLGIRPEFLPFVFERFRQEDSSTTRRHGGLGLGLAIVRHIVEAHGGSVMAESGGEGKGATFTVELPLIEMGGPDVQSSESAKIPQSLQGLGILIVEDDALTRDVLRRSLEPMGATLRAAESASEAMSTLGEWVPNIIVCDIGMPGEDGCSLMRRIRGLPPDAGGNLPAVALTAYVGDVERERAFGAGFDAYLTKPIDPRDLAAEISRVVIERSRS